MNSDIESRIRNELREQEEGIDPIYRLEEIKKELERQLTAEKLLKHLLGEKEYRDFINKGEIEVKSKKYPNRTYIIREFGKIEVVENNMIVERLCINAGSNFPLQDELVAKKLGLEQAEELILKIANHIIPQEFGLLERVQEYKELDLKNLFSGDKEEFLKDIDKKLNKKFDLENLFSDNREEFLKSIDKQLKKDSRRFNIENLFAEK